MFHVEQKEYTVYEELLIRTVYMSERFTHRRIIGKEPRTEIIEDEEAHAAKLLEAKKRIGLAMRPLLDGLATTLQMPHIEDFTLEEVQTLADGIETIGREYRKDGRMRSEKNREYLGRLQWLFESFEVEDTTDKKIT
jgi:hypothetical protein